MLFQAVVIFLPILNFFKFHVKGERSIKQVCQQVTEYNIDKEDCGHFY